MILRVLNNGGIEFPITFDELRNRFPHTSFVEPITSSSLPEGYWVVHVPDCPFESEFPLNQIQDLSPPQWDGEKWIQYWQSRPHTKLELEELKVKKRSERDRLLAASDWTQLPDVPDSVTERYRSYRQNLRDITKNPSFPFVSFPEP